MKPILRALAPVLLTALLLPAPARAVEPERVVVRNRLFTSDGKFEATLSGGLSLNSTLVDHLNGVLGVAYNLDEHWALEVAGGYAYSKHTLTAQEASDNIIKDSPTKSSKVVDDFEDLWQMSWNATGALRWTPIYGKINVAAELPLHFQFYLLLGAGAGGMKRDSLLYCVGNRPSSGVVSCSANPEGGQLEAMHETAVKPVGLGGVGMKLLLTQWFGLRLEVRDMAFLDSYRVKINRLASESDTGALSGQPTQGEPAQSPGIQNLIFAQLGAVFTF